MEEEGATSKALLKASVPYPDPTACNARLVGRSGCGPAGLLQVPLGHPRRGNGFFFVALVRDGWHLGPRRQGGCGGRTAARDDRGGSARLVLSDEERMIVLREIDMRDGALGIGLADRGRARSASLADDCAHLSVGGGELLSDGARRSHLRTLVPSAVSSRRLRRGIRRTSFLP